MLWSLMSNMCGIRHLQSNVYFAQGTQQIHTWIISNVKWILLINHSDLQSIFVMSIKASHVTGNSTVCSLTQTAGIILCMHPPNERRRYIVTSFVIGWAHTQNDSWECVKAPHYRPLYEGNPSVTGGFHAQSACKMREVCPCHDVET